MLWQVMCLLVRLQGHVEGLCVEIHPSSEAPFRTGIPLLRLCTQDLGESLACSSLSVDQVLASKREAKLRIQVTTFAPCSAAAVIARHAPKVTSAHIHLYLPVPTSSWFRDV
jgi:hypothetical protein